MGGAPRGSVRTGVDEAADGPGMVFGHPRRPVDGDDTPAAHVGGAVQPSPRVGPRARFYQPPIPGQSVIHGLANVLVGVVVHRLIRCGWPRNGLPLNEILTPPAASKALAKRNTGS